LKQYLEGSIMMAIWK